MVAINEAWHTQGADHASSSPEAIDLFVLARLAGIEPTTLGFGGQYSIH